MKFFYSAAVQNWDAEFYVKVDDNVDLDLGKYFLFLKAVFAPNKGIKQCICVTNVFRSNRGVDWAT